MSALPQSVQQFPTIRLPAGQPVFSQGQRCENYTVLAEGCVKVFTRSADGRELVLYRINRGEMCVLTTACMLGGDNYPAEAVTESPISAYVIPREAFDRLLDESREFRRFVFNSFSQRLSTLMTQLEQVTLESIGQRLARYLLSRAEDNRVVSTHQDIATEIGSAREVVSRHLKTLEKQGIIKLHRGSVELLLPDALENLMQVNS